jgi:hypothetical protein
MRRFSVSIRLPSALTTNILPPLLQVHALRKGRQRRRCHSTRRVHRKRVPHLPLLLMNLLPLEPMCRLREPRYYLSDARHRHRPSSEGSMYVWVTEVLWYMNEGLLRASCCGEGSVQRQHVRRSGSIHIAGRGVRRTQERLLRCRMRQTGTGIVSLGDVRDMPWTHRCVRWIPKPLISTGSAFVLPFSVPCRSMHLCL